MDPKISIDRKTGLFSARIDNGTPKGIVFLSVGKKRLQDLLDRLAANDRRDRIANWLAFGLVGFVVLVSTVAAWLFS